MATVATSQVLHDGNRNLVMQFTGVSDGPGETNVVKVDVSELNPVPDTVKVDSIDYSVQGGLIRLSWAADDPVPFAVLEGQSSISYRAIGGMVNGGGVTANGDILLSALGFEAGSSYTLKLEMTKKFR